MKKLSPLDPQSARTVVVTTYSTLHTREVLKTERKFVILEQRPKGGDAKRQKTAGGKQASAASDDRSGDSGSDSEDDWMDIAEMLRRRLKKPRDNQKRVTRFSTTKCAELQDKRLHFLGQHEKVQPDGNLVQYKLSQPDLRQVR
jgi:hypothetical protein